MFIQNIQFISFVSEYYHNNIQMSTGNYGEKIVIGESVIPVIFLSNLVVIP